MLGLLTLEWGRRCLIISSLSISLRFIAQGLPVTPENIITRAINPEGRMREQVFFLRGNAVTSELHT